MHNALALCISLHSLILEFYYYACKQPIIPALFYSHSLLEIQYVKQLRKDNNIGQSSYTETQ